MTFRAISPFKNMNKEFNVKIEVSDWNIEPGMLNWRLSYSPSGKWEDMVYYTGKMKADYGDAVKAGKVTEDLKNIQSHLGREGMIPIGAIIHSLMGNLE